MDDQNTRLTETELLARATDAAGRMRSIVAGQPPTAVTQSSAATLLGVADLLNGLTDDVQIRKREVEHLHAALERIADMRIRGAAELFEQGNWKKIAAELHAIGHEAIGRTPAAGR